MPVVVGLAEFVGRHAEVLLDVFAEEREVVEAHLERDFFNRELAVEQLLLYGRYRALCDQRSGRHRRVLKA